MKSQASVFFFVQKLSQNFALYACLKPKVELFDPEWKGNLAFTLLTTFWTVLAICLHSSQKTTIFAKFARIQQVNLFFALSVSRCEATCCCMTLHKSAIGSAVEHQIRTFSRSSLVNSSWGDQNLFQAGLYQLGARLYQIVACALYNAFNQISFHSPRRVYTGIICVII